MRQTTSGTRSLGWRPTVTRLCLAKARAHSVFGFGDPQVIQDGRHPIFGTKVLRYAANGREALDR